MTLIAFTLNEKADVMRFAVPDVRVEQHVVGKFEIEVRLVEPAR